MSEISEKLRIAIIGSGSWATALAKMFMNNLPGLNWYFRKEETIELFRKFHHNPNYLQAVEFDVDRIHFYSDINEIAEQSDILVFAIPSAFLKDALKDLKVDITNKFVVSAIKGIVPDDNLVVGQFFHEYFNVPTSSSGLLPARATPKRLHGNYCRTSPLPVRM
ncbi:NAD(P)-binding domain-containing protein [Prolixibacter bellariivorans]|uniref:NAD(P)-binding domain-containing protein n=1 Tax=Prolixibacter bellariivorans TaxID=314319 RepID=UPI000ADDD71F|nr:NAD(P)-binding domain-containing protein [Prolixibacter bellariivorans]